MPQIRGQFETETLQSGGFETWVNLIGEVNPLEKYKGILKSFRSRKEINAWISDMRGSEIRERRRNRDVCAGN
jgi:hypothetical protein